jgi:hypothetical protein
VAGGGEVISWGEGGLGLGVQRRRRGEGSIVLMGKGERGYS